MMFRIRLGLHAQFFYFVALSLPKIREGAKRRFKLATGFSNTSLAQKNCRQAKREVVILVIPGTLRVSGRRSAQAV